jgi:hypothetical protein
MARNWRRIAATLADPDRRRVYAEAVLGLPGTPGRKREKALDALHSAALIDADGRPTDVFAELLAADPVPAKDGPERWLEDGRIRTYPAKRAQRRELLSWVVEQTVDHGESLDEAALGQRLDALTDDVAALRRYLVDGGLLDRDADGQRYRRA